MNVQDALKARKERNNAASSTAKASKTSAALDAYKKRRQSESQSAISDIAQRINTEIDTVKNLADPSFGKGSLGLTLDSTRESRLNVVKLGQEIESYKGYWDEKTYNDLSTIVKQLSEGYDSHLKVAEFRENFANETEYDHWYKQASEKEAKKNEYNSTLSATDFGEYSQKGASIKNPTVREAEGWLTIGGWRPFGDEIGNIVTYSRDNAAEIRLGAMNTSNMVGDFRYAHMTDEEVSIYNYYLAKYGKEKAQEYLDFLDDDLNQREAGKIAETVNGTGWEAYTSFVAGVDSFRSGIGNIDNYILGKEADPTSVMQYVQSETGKDNEGFWKGTNDLLYTTGNMLPSILISTIPVVGGVAGKVAFGASATGNAYAEMKNLGYDDWQARGYATLVGSSEVLLETLLGGFSKLGGSKSLSAGIETLVGKFDNALARLAIKVPLSMGSEALEEGLQTVLEPAFKAWMSGETYEAPEWEEIFYSSLLGALSAGTLEGVPSVAGTVHTNYRGSVDNGGLSNTGAIGAFFKGSESGAKGFKGVSEAYQTGKQNVNEMARAFASETLEIDSDNAHAQRMQARLDKGKNVSGYQISRMVEANENALVSQDKSKIKAAVEARLAELGESGDVSKIADAIAKTVAGEKLTHSEKSLLKKGQNVWQIFSELNPESMESDWTGQIGTERINAEAYSRNIPTESEATTDTDEEWQEEPVDTDEDWQEETVDTVNQAATATMLDSEGKEVSVTPVKITDIENGSATIELDGGQTVKADSVEFKNSGVGFVYQAATEMASGGVGGFNVDAANVMVRGVSPDISEKDASLYVAAFNEAYRYGAMGYPTAALESRWSTAFLSEKQRETAYSLGKIYGEGKVSAKQANIDRAKADSAGQPRKKGKVHFDGSAVGKSLTERQRASLKALGKVAEAMGIDIQIFESKLVDGKRIGENGSYDPSTRTVRIDLHAGVKGEGLMLYTASHELTHHIKEVSPAKFKVFADALLEEYTKNGISIDRLIANKIDNLKKNGRIKDGMTEEQIYDLAHEEVVADSCEAMLVDSNAIESLSKKLQEQDKGLWETIKDFIAKLVERIRAAYKGLSPDSVEAHLVKKMQDSAERLQKLWVEALLDAAETQQMIGSRNLADFAEAKTENGEQLFQYRAMAEDEAKYRDMLVKWGGMSSVQIDGLFSTIEKAMDIIEDNLEELDYAWEADVDDRAFSPVKPNSDKLYQVSLDFSTLCRKRILQQTVATHLQAQLNKPLSRDEGIAIRDALMALQEEGRKIEVACALCYVESARMKSHPQIKRFFENRETHLREFFASKSGGNIKDRIKAAEAKAREKLARENPDGILGNDGSTMLDPLTASLNSLPKKYADEIREAKRSARESYKPTAEEQKLIDIAKGMTINEFTSPEGLEALLKSHPRLYDAYTSFVRNATHSKGIEGDTWWRAGDSDSIGDTLIANMNRENGLRSQSWSDFQVIHLLDYIAATIELSTRNTKEQAYTKVPDYVELMGLTGVMINMSLIPTAEFNGSLAYDPVEGIDYKRSLELRDKYPDTAGTICIGMDNKQIQLLLADTSIDYVIPYHKSGMSQAVRKLMHIPTWSQYEEYQSEKSLSRAEAEKQAKKYGVTLLPESDPNYQKGTNFSDWFDLEEAQQIAKMENANPSDTAKKEQYGVMYGGYMAMQNAAQNYLKLCAERGIAPKFSHEKADFTAEDNYWKLLIDRKMVNNKTGEIIAQRTIKPIFSETEVLRILNDELERYPGVKADQDYAIRRVTEKMLSGEVRGGMSASEIAKAVKKPVDNVTNVNIMASGDTLYSDRGDTDSSYLEAVKRGDMETAQKMVDEAADKFMPDSILREGNAITKGEEEDGTLIRMYHGSGAKNFYKFESNDGILGKGVYLTSNWDEAVQYAMEKLGVEETEDGYKWNGEEFDGIGAIGETLESEGYVRAFYANVTDTNDVTTSAVYWEDVIALVRDTSQMKSADPVTYDDNGNVIPLSKRFNSENNDIRYSDRDSDGKKLTAEQMEFFKDSAIRDEAGNLMVVYHGTANGGAFTIFEGDKLGNEARTTQIGQGFYFTNMKNEAKSYMKSVDIYGRSSKGSNPHLHQVYLNIKNPFYINADQLDLNKVKAVYSDGTYDYFFNNWIPFYLNKKTVNGRTLTKEEIQSMSKAEKVSIYVDYLSSMGDKEVLSNMVRAFPYGKQGELLTAMKKHLGFDGIVEEFSPGQYQYVAFDSNQVKATTNKTPTSDPDIRYSDRDSDGNRLSKEQMEYFKDSTVRDGDGNLQVVYHGTTSEFSTFERGDIGYHFGSAVQAENRVSGQSGEKRFIKAYLNITNPLVIEHDSGSWHGNYAAGTMLAWGDFSDNPEAMAKLQEIARIYDEKTADSELKKFLKSMGYDGIKYLNTHESAKGNESYSYIAFESNQIKAVENEAPTEDSDIRYSDREVQSVTEAEYESLKKHFGVTNSFKVAGYLLPDGKMLDFSGKHWGDTTSRMRQVDHRDVGEVLGRGNNGVSDMVDMIGSGSIRLMPETGGINLAVYPNEKQRRVLSTYINYMLATEGQVIIDYDSVGGDTVHSKEYGKYASSRQILSDIRNYFNGARQSELMQFHTMYSDRGSYAPTFYSHMGRVIDDVRLERMGTASILNHLKNRGVKAEEIKWSGIETFLEGKKSVTKAELQEFVAGSQLQIAEQTSGTATFVADDGNTYESEAAFRDAAYAIADKNGIDRNRVKFVIDTEYDMDAYAYVGSPTNSILTAEVTEAEGLSPRWSQYKLDGGTNYRELVFQMPDSSYRNQMMRIHWGEDAEGVLAHARIQDMTTSDGKRMLFVEEIQSDWHNEGARDGYVERGDEARLEKLKAKADAAFIRVEDYSTEVTGYAGEWDTIEKTEKGAKLLREYHEAQAAYDNAMNAFVKKVPDAPFRTNYHEYVLKRLLRMAAEEGYDSIGWTPSEIQSDRWSDEFAEGYRIEYDQEIPKFLRKYGKKWGASVGRAGIDQKALEGRDRILKETELANVKRDLERAKKELAVKYDSYEKAVLQRSIDSMEKTIASLEKELSSSLKVWSMDITDSMKESVLYEGQALYSDRQTDSLSNRALLAGALETTVQDDIERSKLELYKQKIGLLNAEEQKLRELRAKIKEISFVKGPRDTEALEKLQFEANQTANRINTYDRQLLELESTKALKGVLEREKKLAYQKAEQRGKEALEKQRERSAKTQRELMERYQESRKKAAEGRYKTAVRHKIKGVVNSLNSYLLNGTKEKHVPIGLQSAVAEALDAVNMDTVGAEERIAKKREEMMIAKTPEEVERIAKEIARLEEMGGSMAAKLARLKTAYDDILNSEDPIVANSYDEVISNTISKVIADIGDTSLRDMNLHQLEEVYDMYKMILATVRNANKAFKAHKSEEISTLANQVIAELDEQKKKKKLQTGFGEAASSFDWNNQKPVYAVERIGSGTFTDVFNSVREGEDVWARDMTEAQAFLEEQKKKYKYKSWDFNKRYSFSSSTGLDFSLTLGQIMSLYAYSRRGSQAVEHLKYGGFVFDGITEIKKKGIFGTKTYKLKDSTAYNLSEGILENIISKLTGEQKGFARAMQDYLSTVMGEKGNEVSLALYDVKLFKEKHYFPLRSAPQFLERAREQAQGDVKIKNKGFTKETTPKSKNPIVLSSFMDVWAGHVNEMSMYHAFALPLEDFYRVYNYKTPASETLQSDSVINYLENVHGNAATAYIDQLLKDLNGGARSDSRETFAKALMSNFKKSAVMASLSVVIQQPSAIVRAQALVDAKHFVGKKMTKGKHKEAWAEVKKYAPVAIIKEMGYFDTGMGKSSAEWLKGEKTWKDKVDDALSVAPALADEVTWVSIWNAVKRETARNNPEMSTSSEEFLKLAGERFTEVIVKTQVYDSTLAKSANMRSKSAFMNMLTAFMAEPTTSINMLQDAFIKGDKKTITRTTGAVLGSVLLNSALVSLVYAMRDDDEDETYFEKYLSRFTTEVIDGINPLTYLPFVKDIWSAAQGFDVERADMTLVTSVIDSFQQLVKVVGKDTSDMDENERDEHGKSVKEAILSIIDNLSSLTGAPVKNIRRDLGGIINGVKTIARGDKTTAGSLGDNILEDVKDSIPVWGWLPDESKGDKLYNAIINGDTAYVDRLKKGYKSESSYESALRKALRENDPRIKEAAEARYNGDIAEYMRIAKEIIAEGNFKQDDVVAAVNSEINEIKKRNGEVEESASSDKVVSLYKVDDYYAAIMSGDSASAYAVKYDLIETDVANGKDRDTAEASFNSNLASHIREKYEAGDITDYKAKDMLSYAGKSAEEAAEKVQYWSFKKQYPDYDLSESAVSKYYSDVKPSGISVSVYYDYSKQRANAKGVDSNGDGKADSGSVKSEVLQIIHSLPISSYQKDVLYRLNGWAESTLWEAPWH